MAVKQMTIWGEWQVVDAAPEPPAWLDDADLRAELDDIERDDIEAMMLDWWWEQQAYAIEDDAGDIIAGMMGH